MIEIERKFLVVSDVFKQKAFEKVEIKQGFLNTDPERTVRVRIRNEEAFLTVKGKSSRDGLSRFEWEKEINKKEAENLLEICEPGKIEKTRYLVASGKFTFEVDEFHGENEGLCIAEVELETKNDSFSKPDWLGKEVTGEVKYYNSQISKNPYKTWKE